jgi:hypothetical protein
VVFEETSLDNSNELTDEKLQELIIEILSGERIVSLDSGFTCIFKNPTSRQRQYSNFLEKNVREKYLLDGFTSEDNLPEELANEIFSIEESENLQSLESKLKGLRLILKKRIKGTDLYFRDMEKVKEIEAEIEILSYKKNSVGQYSAEYMAREEKYINLLCQCTYDLNGKCLYNDYKKFLKENNTDFVYTLLNEFLAFYWGYDTKVIRKIARSGHWRVMYLSAKNNMFSLIDVPAKDASMTFLQLMSWTMYYNNISDIS